MADVNMDLSYLEHGPALCENVTMSISHEHFMIIMLICADALISAVKELGTSNWGDISRRMPTRRSSIQCRRRYTNKVIILALCSCRGLQECLPDDKNVWITGELHT